MAAVIRPATPQDAGDLLRLIEGLNARVGAASRAMTRGTLLKDALGDAPSFEAAVASADGTLAGYAAWCDSYETEHAVAGLYMIDLYVDPAFRRRGLARRLVAHVAATGRRRGRGFVWWTAAPDNADAAGFYETLRTYSEPMIAHALFDQAFETLADEAE